MKKYYCIPCQKKIGEYIEHNGRTDLPKSLLKYKCCLTVGLKSKKEAEEQLNYPCEEIKKLEKIWLK